MCVFVCQLALHHPPPPTHTLSGYLTILSVRLSIYLPSCLLYIIVCLPACLAVSHTSACLSVHLSIYLSLPFFIPIHKLPVVHRRDPYKNIILISTLRYLKSNNIISRPPRVLIGIVCRSKIDLFLLVLVQGPIGCIYNCISHHIV